MQHDQKTYDFAYSVGRVEGWLLANDAPQEIFDAVMAVVDYAAKPKKPLQEKTDAPAPKAAPAKPKPKPKPETARRNKVKKSDIDRALSLARQGVPKKDIASRIGVSESYVYKILRKNTIVGKPPAPDYSDNPYKEATA